MVCMAYVDLNPIRAGIAETAEASEYSSVSQRLEKARSSHQNIVNETLTPICSGSDPDSTLKAHTHTARIRAVALKGYLQLIDWTGRQIREGKTSHIPHPLSPIVERLGFDSGAWTETANHFRSRFGITVGHWDRIKAKAAQTGRHWLHGIKISQQAYRIALTS